MNKQEKYKEDLLKQYINPERIEKAPEGFTSKVMMRIQLEAALLKAAGRLRNKNLVPVISAAITILLIVAAFLIPGSETDLSALPVVELIKNIKVSLPEINLTSIFNFNLPGLLIYVFIGILILTLFDRALNMLFHREK
ncbi:MAG: hypothetical protein Q7T72_03670 [Bacteroidales bacterium]|nr:hypothetical protein [Bacteroidales bacterium]MDP3003105.1 hypothetical protein [Bacteroidales bacterium]